MDNHGGRIQRCLAGIKLLGYVQLLITLPLDARYVRYLPTGCIIGLTASREASRQGPRMDSPPLKGRILGSRAHGIGGHTVST